jgi:hypothetical protein
VKQITQERTLPNGFVEQKVVCDMQHVSKAPFNVMGLNLCSGMGNILTDKTWANSAKNIMDPTKAERRRGVSIF